MIVLETAGLLLFIFYAVSFTKTPFSKLINDPDWQNWAIRLWALALGIGAAIVESHTSSGWLGASVYNAVKEGGAAAVGAIVTYHIGTGFNGAFDVTTKSITATTKVEGTVETPVEVTPQPATAAAEPETPSQPPLTPAQKAALVDLGSVGVQPLSTTGSTAITGSGGS